MQKKKTKDSSGVRIMTKTEIKGSKRKVKVSNKKALHDMVMRRLGRYVGNDEAPPLKTSMIQLKMNDDTET